MTVGLCLGVCPGHSELCLGFSISPLGFVAPFPLVTFGTSEPAWPWQIQVTTHGLDIHVFDFVGQTIPHPHRNVHGLEVISFFLVSALQNKHVVTIVLSIQNISDITLPISRKFPNVSCTNETLWESLILEEVCLVSGMGHSMLCSGLADFAVGIIELCLGVLVPIFNSFVDALELK